MNKVATLGKLSVIITADPFPGVVERFIDRLSDFIGTEKYDLELLIVDSLMSINRQRAEEIKDDNLPFSVRILDPGRERQDQLQAILWTMEQASGAAIIAMDPDMHENISNLPLFLDAFKEGKKIVYAWRKKRYGVPLWRRTLSNLYNIFAKTITNLPLHDFNSPMALFSRDAIQVMASRPSHEVSPRLYALTKMKKEVAEIPVVVYEVEGKPSSYSFTRLIKTGLKRQNEVLHYAAYRWKTRHDH